MKKKNSYKPTDVEYHGGLDYGSNIHSISMQINQYVWNMIKVLDKHDFYGFNFEAKIGSKKVTI